MMLELQIVELTLRQAAVLEVALVSYRRTLLWTIDSLHATYEEKDQAMNELVEVNKMLQWSQWVQEQDATPQP